MQYSWPLIGHDRITQYFAKALSAGRVHHGYLFEGSAHVGKATFARLLAKTLLCESERETTRNVPCGRCRACIAFDHGVHPDFLPLSAGEEALISVEMVREWISSLITVPLLGSRKIGMIEEASWLSRGASNALLKTLEEPAKSVVLFLTSASPLLPTIASRCQRIRFRFAPPARTPAWVQKEEEISQMLAGEEGQRFLWVQERFGSKGLLEEKREECRSIIAVMQYRLRELLTQAVVPHEMVMMCRRTIAAPRYLQANVDPRLVMEYVVLNHEIYI